VWSVRGKREKRVLQGHDADVRGVALSGDGLTAVSCSFDKSVVVWDVKKGMLRERHEGHTDKVFGVALDRKGTRAVSCSWDMSLRVWDTGRRGARPAVLQPPSLGYGSRGGPAAPSSLLGARGPSEAVRVAATRQQGGGPAGAGAGEDVAPLLGPRKARVRVELREEARLPRALDPDDVDLVGDADEAAWAAAILQEEARARVRPAGPLAAIGTGGDSGDEADSEGEDEDEEEEEEEDIEDEEAQLHRKKRDGRLRSSAALMLGFFGLFPWLAGCCVGGGLFAADKRTRYINRASLLFFLLAVGGIAAALVIRFTVPDNALCSACSTMCARPCTGCGECIAAGNFWCGLADGSAAPFCSVSDKSVDRFIEVPVRAQQPAPQIPPASAPRVGPTRLARRRRSKLHPSERRSD
jgi:hypothetical protein